MRCLELRFRYTIFMASSFQNKKALLIDNSSIITKIIKNFLTQTGFDRSNIFSAHDRHKAMLMFNLENFDLVTSGIYLKDASGIDILKEIREESTDGKNKTPFLIISSEKPEINQELLDKYKVSGYIRKPFKQNQLKKVICSIFDQPESIENKTLKSSALTSTSSSQLEESPVEIPSSIVEAFSESTVEAMEQYMVEAIPDNSKKSVELNGYFSALIDMLDSKNRIQVTLIVNFPKKTACDIYEGIFGEVEIEHVCGVVQELCNIIGGIAKSKISKLSQDFAQVVYPDKEVSAEEVAMTWDLGLPEAKIGEGHSSGIEVKGVPQFHVSFKVKDETFHLLVLLQKF